ncbi:MAG: hypothetical protein LC722_03050 [Actinobacteria bacterium]|nr:hypothetical protein [Actinomycetota bacterium]
MTDARTLLDADPGGMFAAVSAMGEHLQAGHRAGLEARDLPSVDGVTSIAVCGMGGSGIPGDAAHALLADRLGVPIVVVKGYRLPAFCHTDALVFVLSYSGNTEEAIGTYRDAFERGCRVVAVTSGGELAALAAEDGGAMVSVPAGLPAPRAAIGYLTGAILGVLQATGLGPAVDQDVRDAVRTLEDAASRLGPQAAQPNPASRLAEAIGAQLFSLVQTAGFVSCYLGIDQGVDPTPIERIEAMKARLRELQ